MRAIQGNGAPTQDPPRWGLSVPDTNVALGRPDGPQRPVQRVERNVLRAVLVVLVLGAIAALTVPITRTVKLRGQLVPERVISIRAGEPGLLTQVHVAAGDTVRPRQLVARLRSPELDEATRASTGHDPTLLARRARLDLHAPPWSERQPDGSTDPSTFWYGGVVLTEDLAVQRDARVESGEILLDLAVLGADDRVAHVVHAWAPEREAQRARPGMPARLTFTAIPQEHPRQVSGVVRRVALAPEADASTNPTGQTPAPHWRVEVAIDPDALSPILGTARTAAELRVGFSVEVAVQERRETIVRTIRRWVRSRYAERTP